MWAIFLIICILLFAFYEGGCRFIWKNPTVKHESFTLTPYYRGNCSFELHPYLEQFFDRHGFYQGDASNWTVYFPCDYSTSVEELEKLNSTLNILENKWVFIVPGDSYLAGKNFLWECLVKKFGLHQSRKYMPNTYLVNKPADINRLRKEYTPMKLYIMKKNTQRQRGLEIVNQWQQIEDNLKDYVVVQELLQDPYLIDGRKINLRVYLLVVCYKGDLRAYMYRDGFVYYTANKFVSGSIDKSVNVTTGYIEREVYEKNPLTLRDLQKYLNSRKPGSDKVMMNRINLLMNRVIEATADKLCQDKFYRKHHMFQLFGVDLALSCKLEPKIMEINKGPDLNSKDERDGKLKDGLMDDIFKVNKFLPETGGHDFVEVWSKMRPIHIS